MYDKESIAKEKCKSRLFKGFAGWMTRHVAVFAAVALVMVSAGLATFETKLVYGGNLSYGTDGATSSPTYTGGSGNNPTVHEPGVIGVSVVTYDMNRMGNSGLEYGAEDDKDVNLSGTYESTPEAYAELKEGSVYNETFEAMAGTPSTRSLYFATGGSEFIVNMQAVYDDYNLDEVGGNKDSYRTTRTYKSIFKKVDCEYKKGDTLKSLAAGKGRETKKKKERAVSSPF